MMMANNLLEWCVEHADVIGEWHEAWHCIEQLADGSVVATQMEGWFQLGRASVFIDWETDYVTKQDWEKARVK